MNITTPTPIQRQAIPLLLAGRDLVAESPTGSGKTLAFCLPMAERLDPRQPRVQALILVPTRELATQVAQVLDILGEQFRFRTIVICGGRSANEQTRALRAGAQAVVGTPGRVLDLLRGGALSLRGLRWLVLDEADEMLDRGFAPDVERILAQAPTARQTALFSATVPDWVRDTAARHLREPALVRGEQVRAAPPRIEHRVYEVADGERLPALRALLDARGPGTTLVFGRTKHGVKALCRRLDAAGYPVAALQGNLSQNARDRVMAAVRAGEVPILIATNVAARGIDVDHIDQVINYELPETPELFTHRVGRTGRMGREGVSITLLAPSDHVQWTRIERHVGRKLPRTRWTAASVAPAAPSAAPAVPAAAPAPRVTAPSAVPAAPARAAAEAPRGPTAPRRAPASIPTAVARRHARLGADAPRRAPVGATPAPAPSPGAPGGRFGRAPRRRRRA